MYRYYAKAEFGDPLVQREHEFRIVHPERAVRRQLIRVELDAHRSGQRRVLLGQVRQRDVPAERRVDAEIGDDAAGPARGQLGRLPQRAKPVGEQRI